MSLNVVHLVGRVGANPECRAFESGKNKCSVSLAVNRLKRDSSPDWFRLEMWGSTARIAEAYVRKGRLIGVQGSLKIDTWVDRNTGENRSSPVIKVDKLELLGSKRDSDPDSDRVSNEYEF